MVAFFTCLLYARSVCLELFLFFFFLSFFGLRELSFAVFSMCVTFVFNLSHYYCFYFWMVIFFCLWRKQFLKQSQDDGVDEVTWKISPVNQKLRFLTTKSLQEDVSSHSACEKHSLSTLRSCSEVKVHFLS